MTQRDELLTEKAELEKEMVYRRARLRRAETLGAHSTVTICNARLGTILPRLESIARELATKHKDGT